jgi:hypothetical protein
VRDTVASVFADEAYRRGLRETLWMRLFDWIGNFLARFWPGGDAPMAARWLALGAIALLVLAVVGRAAYLAWVRRERAPRRHTGAAAETLAGDAWTAAQAAAQQGRYVDAAHLLYAALLDRLAFGGRVHLHPAKTAGDYQRELRRGTPAMAPRFRHFSRAYERVAFGVAPAERTDWERLQALALDVLATRG